MSGERMNNKADLHSEVAVKQAMTEKLEHPLCTFLNTSMLQIKDLLSEVANKQAMTEKLEQPLGTFSRTSTLHLTNLQSEVANKQAMTEKLEQPLGTFPGTSMLHITDLHSEVANKQAMTEKLEQPLMSFSRTSTLHLRNLHLEVTNKQAMTEKLEQPLGSFSRTSTLHLRNLHSEVTNKQAMTEKLEQPLGSFSRTSTLHLTNLQSEVANKQAMTEKLEQPLGTFPGTSMLHITDHKCEVANKQAMTEKLEQPLGTFPRTSMLQITDLQSELANKQQIAQNIVQPLMLCTLNQKMFLLRCDQGMQTDFAPPLPIPKLPIKDLEIKSSNEKTKLNDTEKIERKRSSNRRASLKQRIKFKQLNDEREKELNDLIKHNDFLKEMIVSQTHDKETLIKMLFDKGLTKQDIAQALEGFQIEMPEQMILLSSCNEGEEYVQEEFISQPRLETLTPCPRPLTKEEKIEEKKRRNRVADRARYRRKRMQHPKNSEKLETPSTCSPLLTEEEIYEQSKRLNREAATKTKQLTEEEKIERRKKWNRAASARYKKKKEYLLKRVKLRARKTAAQRKSLNMEIVVKLRRKILLQDAKRQKELKNLIELNEFLKEEITLHNNDKEALMIALLGIGLTDIEIEQALQAAHSQFVSPLIIDTLKQKILLIKDNPAEVTSNPEPPLVTPPSCVHQSAEETIERRKRLNRVHIARHLRKPRLQRRKNEKLVFPSLWFRPTTEQDRLRMTLRRKWNREAAARHRRKKKQELIELEKEWKNLIKHNGFLKEKILSQNRNKEALIKMMIDRGFTELDIEQALQVTQIQCHMSEQFLGSHDQDNQKVQAEFTSEPEPILTEVKLEENEQMMNLNEDSMLQIWEQNPSDIKLEVLNTDLDPDTTQKEMRLMAMDSKLESPTSCVLQLTEEEKGQIEPRRRVSRKFKARQRTNLRVQLIQRKKLVFPSLWFRPTTEQDRLRMTLRRKWNREAAARHRRKKKQELIELEKELNDLIKCNNSLKVKIMLQAGNKEALINMMLDIGLTKLEIEDALQGTQHQQEMFFKSSAL
ncbi:homeobox protein 3 [Biomphalaria glabrata]|nr:homeobox protein 3 [Biomphalaria glabrata]